LRKKKKKKKNNNKQNLTKRGCGLSRGGRGPMAGTLNQRLEEQNPPEMRKEEG